MLSLEELKNELQNSVLEITFTKKNGEERTMSCTMIAEMLASTSGSTDTSRTVADDLLVVTDVNKKEWRSFHYDQITDIKVLEK